MAPSNRPATVSALIGVITSGSVKDKERAVDDLGTLLRTKNLSLTELGDKSYHELFEAIFSYVLREKSALYDKRKSRSASDVVAKRLTKCATAVRAAVSRGASKLKRKTLIAIVEHITQVLPGPDSDFVQPLLQDYVKALSEILSRQAHVEILAGQIGDSWEMCVDFFLDVASHILPEEKESTTLVSSRASPAPGTFSSRSTAKSNLSTQAQTKTSTVSHSPLPEALQGLHYLVLGSNSPILRRSRAITGVILRILKYKTLSLGWIQTLCFTISSLVFSALQTEEIEEAIALVQELVPLMAFWWRADKVSQDELIRALRNEISKVMMITQLHLEYLAIHNKDSGFLSELEDLADPLWLEYSKRSEAFRLQLGDITFTVSNLPDEHLKNPLFGLRPHNPDGESYWALVQNLASLETILLKSSVTLAGNGNGNDDQPRKKRRMRQGSARIKLKLESKAVGVRRTALQLLPFMFATRALQSEHVGDLLEQLIFLAADKDQITASWAFVACASIANLPHSRHEWIDLWRQLWHLAARSISLPSTSRSACCLLQAILEYEILPHHEISDDINGMVTTADVNGPVVLSDTSLSLMLQLFHIRNTRLPSASQSTCGHLIRWAFLRWHPSGPLCTAWKSQRQIGPFNRYLLMLNEDSDIVGTGISSAQTTLRQSPPVSDPTSLYSSRKLILELLYPKLEELNELIASWTKKASEGGTQISIDRFRSLLLAVMIGCLLLPQLEEVNSSQSSMLEPLLMGIAEEGLVVANDSVEPTDFVNLTLRVIRPLIPDLNTSSITQIHKDSPGVLRLLARISDLIDHHESQQSSNNNVDLMDIDNEFDSQASRSSTSSISRSAIPRHNALLRMDTQAFYADTKRRLSLMRMFHDNREQIGLVPEAFVDEITSLLDEDLLLCQQMLIEIFRSDLVVSSDAALNLVERLGEIVSELEYRSSEVALTLCIDVIDGLHGVWLPDTQDLSERVGDLYNHFVKKALPYNMLSSRGQESIAQLVFTLLRNDPEYGTRLKLDSCRTTLLQILSKGPMSVKYCISDKVTGIFELYILKLHDEVFVDVLDSLPKDPDNVAGIAYRLLVLAKLAGRWPTLLRRCTYHIFETPGKIKHAIAYATRCVVNLSKALALDSPQELFRLFSRQLLYTWLESDVADDIPFSVFGFTTLSDLLDSAQADAVGLMIMRGQTDATSQLAHLIATPEKEMIKRNFATSMAYSMIFGDAVGGDDQGRGEQHIEEILGNKILMEARHDTFVDILALFFDLIDQDNAIERHFFKQKDLVYAGEIMRTIKDISHSPAELPPNQQPMFKARHLITEIRRLCDQTIYDFRELWTPALVVSIARSLFSTVRPALGSLHACSVLRKVRILICMSGSIAYGSYALEMLLNSIRSFMVDPECADDALGISQFLLSEGSSYLSQTPSFLAGYALSALASLRVFLESSQSSTTQESQFKATMSKAKGFHSWLTGYLAEYKSHVFSGTIQAESFKSITGSAAHIRSSGNAEKDTAESKLLLDILLDGATDNNLLNEPSRQLALDLLCNDFALPVRILDDVIASDQDATKFATEIWKSCTSQNLSSSYLSWAGRVLGRSFSASGDIPQHILRETQLEQYGKIAYGNSSSETGVLCLLRDLGSNPDSKTSGLAEAALRRVITLAMAQEDEQLLVACQQSLSESLFVASQWGNYRSPPSENKAIAHGMVSQNIWTEDIASTHWLQRLSIHLAQEVPDSAILSVLPPLLANVDGFAEKVFPFVVHMVLLSQLDKQHTAKRLFSGALKTWLQTPSQTSKERIKLLLNTILYLRTREFPNETSIADRGHWLDIDYTLASSSANSCGMYKTALLFAEIAASENTRSSRRSSAVRETDLNDTLLQIFESIDDPDAYYGLPEEASLATVLARVEYENEGTKSLAFRGAQYDSHLRSRDGSTSALDSQALVKALSTLGLSGLSHSLMQTQQSIGTTPSSLDSTFGTAQKLEMWNLPAPVDSDHHSVVVYKAFQTLHHAADALTVRAAIYDGYQKTMKALTSQGLNATAIRRRLGALAALTELDDIMNIADAGEVEGMLSKFESRGSWMQSGLYDDVSQILSCRGTTMSMISQHPKLLNNAKLTVANLREMQVKSTLESAGIYRYHQATQESINISTALTDLVPICETQGIYIDAAVSIEAANSLWDHGEMGTSIRMLQGIDKDSRLKKQSIPVSRSDLLSKIGHQVSLARLEKPQDIQKKYLEPALKELKGNVEGQQAGSVYHQFAMFCDEQLQDPAGLEDLTRLQGLRKGKSDEVVELQSLISATKDSQLRNKYSHVLAKEKQWLNLDEQELRRVEQTRNEFVRLSVENYLLSLSASDKHNNDALRFTALWLERSSEDATNKAVQRHLSQVPTRKFATLMNQLSSRLQSLDTPFQRLLLELVYNICVDHPYHGMYQIWSGTKARTQQKDEVAIQRVRATEKVAQKLASNKAVAATWLAIDKTSKYYHILAMDRNTTKYKSGLKIPIKESSAGHNLVNCLAKYRVPPPTMHIELSVLKDYSSVPTIAKLDPTMTIASGVSAPKIITAVGTNGARFKQLVKGGNDDLRQDAIMEQVFAAVSSLLKLHRAAQQRNLGIRTYKVLPLTASSGLIEFVPHTIPLHEFLMPAHERYYPKDLKGSQCRKEIFGVQSRTVETRINTYRKVTERFHPVMKYFFMEYFEDPDDWFVRRLAYTRSTAAISMLGHVLGLGDRHGHNILLDTKTGEVVHIDLGVAFEAGRILPVPELVPFRLTRDIVDGMGITKTEGVFRRCCEFTLDALREEQYSIMTILDVLRFDPLYTWSISPLRLAKLQKARNNDEGALDDTEQSEAEAKKGKRTAGDLNEPSEADRALEIVRKKLSKTLSVTAMVNDLINQAMDECNLAVLYSGWAAYA